MTAPIAPSICVPVAGPVQVWIDSGTTNTLAFLGYSENGVRINERPFTNEIKSDQYGGESGPPIDRQIFGWEHKIEIEMVYFQPTVLAALEQGWNTNSTSALGVGSLMTCAAGGFRCMLIGPNFIRNYPNPIAQMIDPVDYGPFGSQNTKARVTLTCVAPASATTGTSGTFWNLTNS